MRLKRPTGEFKSCCCTELCCKCRLLPASTGSSQSIGSYCRIDGPNWRNACSPGWDPVTCGVGLWLCSRAVHLAPQIVGP